jgi:hypothetical protein
MVCKSTCLSSRDVVTFHFEEKYLKERYNYKHFVMIFYIINWIGTFQETHRTSLHQNIFCVFYVSELKKKL